MNSLIKSALIALAVGSVVGCAHEARVTGPTQCMAPRSSSHVVQAAAIVQGRVDLTAQASANSL